MKLCTKCNLVKKDEDFYKNKMHKDVKEVGQKGGKYLSSMCVSCQYIQEKERIVKNPERYVWKHARDRAKLKNLEFTISEEDIIIPQYCPVLGIELKFYSEGKWASPSLDRIKNNKGYVKGNILVISNRANWLKGAATLEELEKLYKFYSRYQ